MNRKRTILILAILTLVSVFAAQAQDAPPQLNLALADLAARLQKTVTLDKLSQWTYAQNFYTDTGFGCSLVTGSPAPEGISAYTFRLTFEGVTYEYRVSLDGQIVFPCDSNLLQVFIPTPSGDIGQCPTGFTGFLPPRLRINSQGRVEEGGAPNRLRSAPSVDAGQIGVINPGRTFDVIGGPSCDDKGFVWWQIVIDGQVGWTAEGALPDDYYVEPVGDVSTPANETATPIPLTSGNVVAGLPILAAITDNRLTLYSLADGLRPEVITQDDEFLAEPQIIQHMVWSPDGKYLVYLVSGDQSGGTLYLVVIDSMDTNPIQLATGLAAGVPVNFTPDGTRVIYAVQESRTPTEGQNVPTGILVQGVLTREAPSRLATIDFGVGCGGGSPYPGDWQLNSEKGSGLILELTPAGLVYSTNCTGAGTALLNLETGDSVELGTALSRVDVSPDGSWVVGISRPAFDQPGVLTVVDLETLNPMPLGTTATPDIATWGANGEIYYSVFTPTDEAIPDVDSPALSELSLSDLRLNRVAIHRVDLEVTRDTELYKGEAYGIGRMFAAPDGDTMYFSAVPNGQAWVAAVNGGSLNMSTSAYTDILRLFPVSLYRLSLADGSTELVGEDMAHAAFNTAAYDRAG